MDGWVDGWMDARDIERVRERQRLWFQAGAIGTCKKCLTLCCGVVEVLGLGVLGKGKEDRLTLPSQMTWNFSNVGWKAACSSVV